MRYINFVIDGKNQDILVHMEELRDGSVLIRLTVDGKPADIRGLFFDINDSALISKLLVSGANVTSTKFLDEGVMDLGNGVNMHGNGRGPFDVGVAFGSPGNGKDMVTDTSLVLKSSIGTLTLDDLALVDFGVRLTWGGSPPKMVMTAPAAPDAINDTLVATEDTQSIYLVLANDTDADGTADFKITSVTDPEHGTATISTDGKTVIYVPDLNYSGPDSFGYTMIDGHGGGDNAVATIGIVAVADAPTMTVTTAAGANVNQILVTVSAQVTDIDGSEYVDRFDFSGLPAGATIVGETDLTFNPTSTGQTLSQTFTLTLAPNTDFNFTLGVSAVAKELSNGDEEATAKSVEVIIDSNTNNFNMVFEAIDQSIWSSGSAFTFTDDRFIGFDVDPAGQSGGGFIYYWADIRLKAGFQSTLTFNGGSIDAVAPVNVAINTTYNHLTDVLLINSTSALLSGGVTFATDGPSGKYILDFIFNYAISAGIGIDYEVDSEDIFGFSQSGDYKINILTADSDQLALQFNFDYGLSITLSWPNVDTNSLVSSGTVFHSSGASNNFLELAVDVDQALADIFLDGQNPFDRDFSIGIAWANVQLLDVDLTAGMNFLQSFSLAMGNLGGVLTFENGATRPWNFADIILTQASTYDADKDGIIEFALTLDQGATLRNQTDLGFNMGYSFDLLKANGGYDVLVHEDDFNLGPVYHAGQVFPLASVPIYVATFNLDFAAQTITFNGNDTFV